MNHARRKIVTVKLDVANVREIEIPSDSRIFSVVPADPNPILVMACPDDSATVKRFVWMIPEGMEFPATVQESQYLGALPGIGGVQAMLVFVEEQDVAIIRSQHRRLRY